MKKSIKIRLKAALFLCMMLLVGTSYAQQRGSQRGGQGGGQEPPPLPTSKEIKKMVNDLAEEISLDEGQEDEILDLYAAHFDEVEDKTKSAIRKRYIYLFNS